MLLLQSDRNGTAGSTGTTGALPVLGHFAGLRESSEDGAETGAGDGA